MNRDKMILRIPLFREVLSQRESETDGVVHTVLITKRTKNVLPTVVDPGTVNTKACKSGAVGDACHVYGTLSNRILPGTKAMHYL